MKTLLKHATLWREDHRFESGVNILIENDTVVALGTEAESNAADVVKDLGGAVVIPGLVDVHTHGRDGADFSTCTEQKMKELQLSYV